MKKLIFLTTLIFAFIATSWGQTFTAQNADGKTIRYQVITGTNTVEVMPPASNSYTDVIDIPAFVKNGTNCYAVTTIGEGAFERHWGYMTYLDEVTFPSTILTLKEKAVWNTRIAGSTTGVTIKCLSATPPSYDPSTLTGTDVFNRRGDGVGIWYLDAPTAAYLGWGNFQQRNSHTAVPNLNTYTVTLDLNEGTLPTGLPSTFEVCNGYNIGIMNLPVPTYGGIEFLGWSMDGTTLLPADWEKSNWNADVTLYAIWNHGGFSIDYEGRRGMDDTAWPQTYNSAIETTLPVIPNLPEAGSRPGLTFLGWHYSANGVLDETSATYDADLAAVFATTAVTTIPAGTTGDRVYYAKWQPIPYTITYKDDNGITIAGLTPNSYVVSDPTVTLPTYTKTGYDITAWYETMACDGATTTGFENILITNIYDKVIGDKTYYAKMTPVTYTITYKEKGGTEVADDTYNVEDPTITLPTTTREGYQFGGWFTAPDCASEENVDNPNCVAVTEIVGGSTGNKTFHACWIRNTYTVEFDINGGDGTETMSDITCRYDTDFNLTTNTFTKTGYTFLGWDTDQNVLAPTYSNNQLVSNLTTVQNGTVTLYAIWTPGTFTLTFDANGGNIPAGSSPMNPTYDAAIGELPTVTPPAGFEFIGWYIGTRRIEATTVWDYADDAQVALAHYIKAEVTKMACEDAENGQIDITVSPANATRPYDIQLVDESVIAGTNAVAPFNVGEGTYSVKVVNETDEYVTISDLEIEEFIVELTHSNATDIRPTHQVVFAATGTEGHDYTYTWNANGVETVEVANSSMLLEDFVENNMVTLNVAYFAGEATAHCQKDFTVPVTVVVCSDDNVSDVDGNNYQVGDFANTCWFRENFKGVSYVDGNSIPFAEGYYVEDPEEAEQNIELYGRLYKWTSAAGGESTIALNENKKRGVCPEGWRLPTAAEMSALSAAYTAEELKGAGWVDNAGSATSAFNALPAGIYNNALDRFELMYTYTAFWSSSVADEITYGQLSCYCGVFEIEEITNTSEVGFSVRCVENINAMAVTMPVADAFLMGSAVAGDYVIATRGFMVNGQEVEATPIEGTTQFKAELSTTPGTYEVKAFITIQGQDTKIEGDVITVVVE